MTSFVQNYFCRKNLVYYTTWSNILFYTVIILYLISYLTSAFIIPDWLLYAVIVNIIAVGLIGNLLYCFNFGNIFQVVTQENPHDGHVETTTQLYLSNFISHTLPLILCIIVLLLIDPVYFEMKYALIFLGMFALVWLIVPTNAGKIFYGKVCEVYLDPPLLAFFLLPVIWYTFLKLIQISRTKKCNSCNNII